MPPIVIDGVTLPSYADPADVPAALRAMSESLMPKGGGTFIGLVNMGGNRISGLGSPTSADDATHKQYVDGKVGAVTWATLPGKPTTFAPATHGPHPTADAWTTATTIALGGDLSGSISLKAGGKALTWNVTVLPESHHHNSQYAPIGTGAFLPLAGGTMTGSIVLPTGTLAAPSLRIGNEGGLYSDISNSLEMKAGAESFRFSGNGKAMMPKVTNRLGLGGADYKWTAVYAQDGSINTSDPSQKHIDGRVGSVLDQILKVDPIRFRWRDRDKDTNHFGFDATEIQKEFPDVVVGEPGNLSLRERDLLAILWAAVRELAGARVVA